MPDGRGKDGARLICKLFHTIWMTCYDGRSVAWALRAGVLPLMVALNAEEETTMVSDALFAITGKACHVRVIRALRSSDGGEVMSFRGSVFRKPEELEELDRWLKGRADLWYWEYQNQRCRSQQVSYKRFFSKMMVIDVYFKVYKAGLQRTGSRPLLSVLQRCVLLQRMPARRLGGS